jgi:broad specificity phosphatase PhoE
MFLQRHGECVTNRMKVFTCRKLDPSLTETGRRQIENRVLYYGSFDIERIVTSPSKRAIESAEILSSRLGIDYQTNECLLEIDVGDLEGESERDPENLQRFFSVIKDWLIRSKNTRFPGGESKDDVEERLKVLDSLISSNPAILVGHATLFAVFLGTRGNSFERVEHLFLARAGIARYCPGARTWSIES